MNAAELARRGAVAAILVLLVTGCSGKSSNSAGVPTETATVDVNTAPATEGTDPEAPQSKQNAGPSISIASLPIGGNVDEDGTQQCAEVNWLGPKPIPQGVTITIDAIGLDPEGIFELDSTCGDRPCQTSWQWVSATESIDCTVAARQVVDSDQTVTLVLSGTVHCGDDNACDEFRRAAEDSQSGSQIRFEAQLGVVTGGSDSSESPSAAESSTGG